MLGIRAKIVLPFTLLFVATIVAVAFLAARAAARDAERRVQAQMADLAAVLSQAGFASNPEVLSRVKAIVGGELASVDSQHAVVATTLDEAAAEAFAEHVSARPPRPGDNVAPTRRLRLGGRDYRAVFAEVQGGRGRRPAFVCLLLPEQRFRSAARGAARPILVAAACGAVVVAAVGFVVGGAIARPVQALAAQARGLARGDPAARLSATSRDEVGRLAEAFNSVLDSLRAAEARLVESERLAAVGQVAAGIAHEVRNPLSGIKMSAQLLGRKLRERGAPDEESVAVMLAEIARLEVIIDDLLTFAHPTRLAREPADLNAVVEGVLEFMARQFDHAGVAVRRDLAEDLPAVPLDPRRIRQVVLNLVLNAVEAMASGGTLTVRTRATGDAVVAEVEDTGHGIPPDVAARMFEPFYTTKPGGSGLGLGVSRTVIEAHGGTLDFEPLERGTRFAFTLPRRSPIGDPPPAIRNADDGEDRGR